MPPLPETLTTRLSSLLRRAPVTCPPDTPIRAALGMMRRDKVDSILLVNADGRPAGVFTLNDLRDRVAAEECDLDWPMRTVMTPTPFFLDGDATALEAAPAMAQRLIHHGVVTLAEGRILGVVSEKDLFALQRLGVGHIAAGDREAESDQAQLAALGLGVAPLRRLDRVVEGTRFRQAADGDDAAAGHVVQGEAEILRLAGENSW